MPGSAHPENPAQGAVRTAGSATGSAASEAPRACEPAPRLTLASGTVGARSNSRRASRKTLGCAGFTYVGVMIFVAILGVVSAAALSAGSSLDRRAKEEELLFIGREFAQAFRSYFEATPAGQRNYPAKLEELLRDPRYPGVRRHLRRIYVDPMTGRAEWGLVPAPGGIVGVHSLSERAPLKVAEFEPAFAPLTGRTSYIEWKFGFAPPGLVLPGNPQLAGTIAPVMKPVARKPTASPTEVAPFLKEVPPVPPAPIGPGRPIETPDAR